MAVRETSDIVLGNPKVHFGTIVESFFWGGGGGELRGAREGGVSPELSHKMCRWLLQRLSLYNRMIAQVVAFSRPYDRD